MNLHLNCLTVSFVASFLWFLASATSPSHRLFLRLCLWFPLLFSLACILFLFFIQFTTYVYCRIGSPSASTSNSSAIPATSLSVTPLGAFSIWGCLVLLDRNSKASLRWSLPRLVPVWSILIARLLYCTGDTKQ